MIFLVTEHWQDNSNQFGEAEVMETVAAATLALLPVC